MRQVARLLVILPTLNEKANLSGLIPATDFRLHVLVVDDNSPDGTADAVRELMATLEDRRLFLETRTGKLGLASAYLHGFSGALTAGYDFMIEMDADWSHQPKYPTQTKLRQCSLSRIFMLANAERGISPDVIDALPPPASQMTV
jgi:GT2 family glycosyltransferase